MYKNLLRLTRRKCRSLFEGKVFTVAQVVIEFKEQSG